MNSDAPGDKGPSDKTRPHEGVALSAGDHARPADIPVFNCIVYLAREPGGGVRARVANLAGLACTAASEREALGKIVPAFKQRVSELVNNDTPIPWIEPPILAEPGEQPRFIAVHL